MSGECEICHEHTLDCVCERETRVGLIFSMPYETKMEIRSSKTIDENIASDEEVEGIVYHIFWDGTYLPWCTNTLLQATAIAFGCQWGAYEMKNKRGF